MPTTISHLIPKLSRTTPYKKTRTHYARENEQKNATASTSRKNARREEPLEQRQLHTVAPKKKTERTELSRRKRRRARDWFDGFCSTSARARPFRAKEIRDSRKSALSLSRSYIYIYDVTRLILFACATDKADKSPQGMRRSSVFRCT